ncbi:CBS domain-containing protein [Caldanaerovirga acetigignens]|uniref:CBS domain-containing protein n=1 Tax=Caldanaerovirga acetigignens TaxID=447595 RepID=A0A1M7JV58_9FIRM|nr:CBS domain-containing protein [Caldanaerovirga acetigignens]SHM56906.1 CBS domain-containing protein [Caldanaerovirga acetigignens]
MEDIMKDRCDMPVVPPDADLREVAKALLESEGTLVVVEKEEGVYGYIDGKSIIKWFLMGDEGAKFKAKDIATLIKDEDKLESSVDIEAIVERINKYGRLPLFIGGEGKITGRFSPDKLIGELIRSHSEERKKRVDTEHLIGAVIDLLPFGIALVSDGGEVVQANKLATEIMRENSIGTEELKAIIKNSKRKIFTTRTGTYYRMCTDILRETDYFLVTFADITAEYAMVEKLRSMQNEVETAFSIMLPDQRIEARLKSIVEYMDEYDESTGMIKITGVIKNGCFRHVINMLKLIADAFSQGLMELPGMEKNALVQAAVLHDIGKVQPDLKVGDVVNPKEAFEKGHLHAFRGADLSRALYAIDDKVYYLIKFHHHEENELPSDFPKYLLPMYRFFRLIDGLSAGITRRGSRVTMKVRGTKIHVREESSFPAYNQEIEMDIYTGFFANKKIVL